MRIALLSNAAVVHTERWAEFFRGRGHEVALWSLEPGPDALGARPLPVAPLPGWLRYPLAAPAARRAVAAFRPDVVNAHFVPNYGVLATLAGLAPLVVTAWGSDLLVAANRNLLQRARARFVLTHADAVLADALNLADAARAHGAPAQRVHCIPWGVDRARFHAGEAREPGLLVSARMHETVYDVGTILDAAGPVMRRHPHTRLVVAGDGALRATLEARAKFVLPAGRYEFVGRLPIEPLAALMRRADVYLSASHSDSTSVSLLEAMSAGAVPVVSDIEGNREWVADGDGARLFPPGQRAALEAAIESALADPAWCGRARARNLRVIAERGDRETNFARIETLFETVARRGARA